MLQLVLIAVALVVVGLPLATHQEWRTVVTGSMRPLIQPGDVVLVSPQSELPEIGDIVAFPDPTHPDRDVVHRVAGFTDDGLIITKGDANDTVDPWRIEPSQVIGATTLSVPKVGFVVEALNSKAGILIFLVLPALAIMIGETRVWYRYVRYGAEAFGEPVHVRQPPPRGKHMAKAPA